MEAALRTVADLLTGSSSDCFEYDDVRGLEGIKIATVKAGDLELRAAVAHGLGNARKLMDAVRAGEKFDFIEIMACPGGCVNGGRQPPALSEVRSWLTSEQREQKPSTQRIVTPLYANLTTTLPSRSFTRNISVWQAEAEHTICFTPTTAGEQITKINRILSGGAVTLVKN